MAERDLAHPGDTARAASRPSAESVATAQIGEEANARRARDGEVGEWLGLAEAQQELGVTSEDVVEYWAGLGWLRSRTGPDGRLEVLRADVVREKTIREGLGAIGGRDLTPEELDELEQDLPGTLPWERAGADPSR